VTNDTVYLVFIGAPGDSPSSYTVQGAAQVSGPYAAVPATITVGTNPGEFLASLPVTSVAQFLRVMKRGSTPPPTGDVRITDITFVGSSVTLLFTGAAGDAASAFKLMAAPAVVAGYQQVPAVITLVSPGSFKAVAPATGSAQFYKISK
jgi:hypothetical protein